MAENEEHAPAEGGEPKKSNLALIIVAVVLVLVLIIGGVVAFFMLSSHDEHADANATTTEHAAEGHDKEAKAEEGHGEEGGHEGGDKEHKKGADSVEVGPMFPLTVFIVNLMSDTGGKYLKTTVSLELSDPKLTHEVESKKDRIRDYILGILSSKTVEEISTAKGKDDLKSEITEKINGNLKDGEVRNVYFTDFVIQ